MEQSGCLCYNEAAGRLGWLVGHANHIALAWIAATGAHFLSLCTRTVQVINHTEQAAAIIPGHQGTTATRVHDTDAQEIRWGWPRPMGAADAARPPVGTWGLWGNDASRMCAGMW